MNNNLSILLKEYGLDDNEINIFLFLVGNKELTAYKIAKEIKINRSTCYDILERLISKGFVSKIEKQKKSYYSSNDISRVISSLKDKETILLNIIPKFQEIEQKQETKIKFLEGIEGQKQFNFNLYNLTIKKKVNNLYVIGNAYTHTLGSKLFIERLIKEFKKKKLKKYDYKGIWDKKFEKEKIMQTYNLLGENRFLDNIASKVTTAIYDGGVAFLYTTDKPYVIEIKNKILSDEMKNYFLHLWKLTSK